MDDSYRPILPWIRPRSESFPWLTEVLLVVLFLFIVVVLISYLIRKYRWNRHTWHTFLNNAHERGVNEEQSKLLMKIARHDRMKHPFLLLSSINAFDRHVGRYAARLTHKNTAGNNPVLDEISHIRRTLGFDQISPAQPLHTTREIEPGQTLMVWPVKGRMKGFTQCVVVYRDDYAITAVPLLREADRHLDALVPGDRLKVRFRRKGDTEYRFRTEILDTVPETTTVIIRHADHLERIQKRDLFRLDVNFPLTLYPAPEKGDPEGSSGNGHTDTVIPFEGRAIDISGGGLGVLTQKKVPAGSALVIDPAFKGPFPLAHIRCKVMGQVKTSQGYRVHLEFISLSREQEEELVHRIYQQEIHRAVA